MRDAGWVISSALPVINNVQTYSTSKLHYYLRLKSVLDMHIQMVKLDVLPWGTPSETHPLVPLRALDRVRDRQQICVGSGCGEPRLCGETDKQWTGCGLQCGCAGRFLHQSSVRLLAGSSR